MAEAVAGCDLARVVVAEVGTHLHQVGAAADARQLVGRQVVVDVGDIDAERLAAQEAQGEQGSGGVEHQAVDAVTVMSHRLPCALENVRRVITHQVVQPPVVVAPVTAVELGEGVQPGAGLAPVADAEFHDVELGRQGMPGVQLVPHAEQLADHLRHGRGVARIALPARQRPLVLPAGGLLPSR